MESIIKSGASGASYDRASIEWDGPLYLGLEAGGVRRHCEPHTKTLKFYS